MKRLNIWTFCAFLAAATVPQITGAAEKVVPESKESQNLKAKSRIYTHPVRGFTIAIPPGAQVLERDEKNPQLSVRSRKGYMVNLQSGTTNPAIALKDMPIRLEAKYLGEGKPWSHKIKQNHTTISGLPAVEVFYQGTNSRARVDIIRGPRTDHVFIFFAGEREYPSLIHEYEWMLSHFRPGPDDIVKPRVTLTKNSSLFNEPGFGYSIRYPLEWEQAVPTPMTAMFSGKEGSPSYSAIVSVQNVAPPRATSSENAAELALAGLVESLQKSVQKLRYIDRQDWSYDRNGHQIQGREVVVAYSHAGQDFMKRIIVVPRPYQNLAHIWSYTAPISIFKSYAETADRMLQSWEITGSQPG